MIRIALADDHQLVLDGLKALIKQHDNFEFIAEANNGKQLVDLVNTVQLDVVLVDIDMPIMTGLKAIEEINSTGQNVKCIALTMHNEKGMIQQVIAAGASGYMLKNIDQQDLITAIEKVASGGKYFSEDVTLTLAGNSQGQSLQVQNQELNNDLTDREIEVLKLIANGFSNKEIGEKLFISHRTVDTHRTNIMKKLDVHNIASVIRYALRSGYVE